MSASSDVAKRITLARNYRDLETSSTNALEPPCSLRKALACCSGKGYRISAHGAVAQASLCPCVSSCAACAGRARVTVGNDSRPCLTPPPNVVVNLLNAALIPARYAEASLKAFRNFTGNGRQIIAELQRWRGRFKPSLAHGLVLEGPVGVGKTYILAALAKDFAERGWSVRFTDFFQLLGQLKAGFAQGKADAAQLAPLIAVDILFIDELGKGRNTDFELTVLDQLVCGRYNQNKTIIASTNFRLRGRTYEVNAELDRHPGGGTADFATGSFATLEQRIGPRIFSRLAEMTEFVELRGDDFRRDEARRQAPP